MSHHNFTRLELKLDIDIPSSDVLAENFSFVLLDSAYGTTA